MIVVPVLTLLAVAYLCRARSGAAVGANRLALLRAAVVVAGVACLAVEVLSAFGALNRTAFITGWIVALVVAGTLAVRSPRFQVPLRRDLGLADKAILGTLGVLFLLDLIVALVAPPNNYDSQTYHLPKIEHWVQQGDVTFYATVIDRQLAMAPGAEYLLLHLRLLTGGDGTYNLVQLAAGVGVVLIATRICKQLGGSTRAQLITALIVGTTPMVLLEATSTQTDLVVALWVGCVATFAIDGLRRVSTGWETALLGAAAGLTLLTKATGLIAAGLLLAAWAVAQVRLKAWRGIAGAAAVGVLMAAFSGPFLLRIQQTYGHPLGPEHLRASISMQRHDPAAVLVNALRIAETALQTPVEPVNDAVAAGIIGFAHAIGVDPQSREITYWNEEFPDRSWPPDEDRVSLPVQGMLVLAGALALLVRRSGLRGHAAVFWVAVIVYVSLVKWQPWGNRLVLFLLVIGAPLAGLWIAGLAGKRVATWVTTAALICGAVAGGFAIGYGWPRRLVGNGSVFTTGEMEQRFLRRPEWQPQYEWAAAAVRATGAQRVGLIQGYNTWEYPWWVLLGDKEIVPLQSLQPSLPAAALTDVDVVLCVKPPLACEFYVPATWNIQRQGDVAYGVKP